MLSSCLMLRWVRVVNGHRPCGSTWCWQKKLAAHYPKSRWMTFKLTLQQWHPKDLDSNSNVCWNWLALTSIKLAAQGKVFHEVMWVSLSVWFRHVLTVPPTTKRFVNWLGLNPHLIATPPAQLISSKISGDLYQGKSLLWISTEKRMTVAKKRSDIKTQL